MTSHKYKIERTAIELNISDSKFGIITHFALVDDSMHGRRGIPS